jgi:poly-gamma-glutamate synthesis protein (capsule biosynthesis protein)
METKILITGDYCPIGRNLATIESQNYALLFGGFESISRTADIAITNLESPITDSKASIEKSGPNLKVSGNALLPLSFAGFNMVTLANNHIMDYGSEGLKSTFEACKQQNISYVGAGVNLEEARKPAYITHNGQIFAFINFAENEFCTTSGKEYGANPLNVIANHYDIAKAKENADYVIVISHGGREHYPLPTPQLRERFRFFVDSGADIVVGHHTHCISGIEQYKGKHIFYSLGNFIFDYKTKYQKGLWTQGLAVMFSFKDKNISFDLIPFHQGRKENPGLVLLNESERKVFDEKVFELSSIIIDDELFMIEWEKYTYSQKTNYKSLLMIQNKYIRALMSRGWLPGVFLHSKAHQNILLNLLKCETHREIMIDLLNRKIN